MVIWAMDYSISDCEWGRMCDEGCLDGLAPHLSMTHVPVLYTQAMEGLRVVENGTYLDGTFGRGGHARGVLQQLGPGGRLLVMDKDPEAIAMAERVFSCDPRVVIRHGSFALLAQLAAPQSLDGVLFDLGVSSPQLDVPERGFSFAKDGPLDMRMDPEMGRVRRSGWHVSPSVKSLKYFGPTARKNRAVVLRVRLSPTAPISRCYVPCSWLN